MSLDYRHVYLIDFIATQKPQKIPSPNFADHNFTIIIVNAGKLHLTIKGGEIQVIAKNLLIITGPQYYWEVQLMEQSEIWMLSFNPLYFYGSHLEKNAPSFLSFLMSLGYSKLKLKSADFSILIQWFNILYKKDATPQNQPYEHKVLFREIQILMRELREIYFNSIPEFMAGYQHKYLIVFRFLQHLELHFKTQHSVQFYSNSLYLSADYLSRIVKEVIQKNAKQCIEEKIMDTAKLLLIENRTISQIGAYLGFKTTSHFCYFFKKHTSLSPSAFRKQDNKSR